MKTFKVTVNESTYLNCTWPVKYNGRYRFKNTLNNKNVIVKNTDYLSVLTDEGTYAVFQNPLW